MEQVLIKVAQAKDVPTGKSVAVNVEGAQIALFNVDDTYYAIDDTCTHAGGSLSEGQLHGTVASCPWHGATFDIASGKVLGAPAPSSVGSYEVQVEGEDVMLKL